MRFVRRRRARLISIMAVVSVALLFGGGSLVASITDPCANCHTMHNSQDNNVMATFNSESGPNDFLTRGSCVGCHAQAGATKIVSVGSSEIPQVLHTDAIDLAGGNFAYINGIKGSGAADNKGHNVIDVVNQDGTLYGPPGGINQAFHNNGFIVNNTNLTCAGDNGCHGYRVGESWGTGNGSGIKTLKGAHHGNVDGQLTVAGTVADSYRFLLGVKGLENPNDRWQNLNSTSHNEYYGETTPALLDCSAGGCHIGGYVQPPNNTISGFCGTCHGNFHTLETSSSSGIGSDIISPFIRHPNDVVIKDSGEYANYTNYSTDAPVGRPSLPANPSATVTPGTDVVTCLSCHVAHASNYSDMLRWDYTQMIAGGGGADGTGCFICHTTKDD